ncbi:uncharacterized protein LOC126905996 [Daktulosphaira vitifoliae]|uniref:uncharacterized protein LOC126905996 n=1 Tax=Daktulosphaira vitifoliae TaxID=58002 RepID=UPI0021A99AF9|nr:uncharacterized protein LOC126905996 [Daktulosphaira vitifoliae]
MHLKTIIIFCAVGFFTDTMSEGLNAIQIQCIQMLTKKYNDDAMIRKFLNFFFIEVNDEFVLEDNPNTRTFEILKMFGTKNKLGDDKNIEKLEKEEVEAIINVFSSVCQNGLIKETGYIQLIDLIRDYIKNEETVNDWKTNINKDNRKSYDLGDVMLELLRYRAQLNNTVYGKQEDVDIIDNTVFMIELDHKIAYINNRYSLF